MKRLLGVERIGGRVEKTWLHTGDDGTDRITVETVQDVDPIIRAVKLRNDMDRGKSDLRFKAEIPFTLLEEMCRLASIEWGCKARDAFQEVMQGKTDRAQRVLRTLTDGRDFRKLQAEKRQRYVKVENGTRNV